MEFIIANQKEELGFLTPFSSIDIDLGKDMDFQIELNLEDYDAELFAAKNIVFAPVRNTAVLSTTPRLTRHRTL